MILAGFFLLLSVVAYSISQLQQHGKLKCSTLTYGFWGSGSWWRKYKTETDSRFTLAKAPDNFYYRFFKIKYKEKFPLSATFLVSFTDGYHLMQSISFICLALCISILSNVSFWYVWLFILLVNGLTYKIFSR